MIRSMVSKMIRSMITTVINPFDGLISRYFIPLDPVLNSYYEMAAPITFTGDFEIEVEFSTTDTSNQILIGDSHTSSYYFNMDNNSFDVHIAGAARGFAFTPQTPQDGKLHKVKYKLTGTSMEVFLDGVSLGSQVITPYTGANNFIIGNSNSVNSYFDGIIANAKFTDQSGASDVVTTFKLDNSPAAANYVYGGEEVVNGDFATTDTSYWTTINAGVTIAGNGVAVINYSGGYSGILVNQAAFQGGSSYSVSIVVDSVNSGGFDLYLYSFVETINSSGVYTYIVNGPSSGKLQLAGSNFTGILSSITVKEITNYTEANAASEIEYSQENVFGSEEVVNGDFATADTSYWSSVSYVTITGNGVASIDGTGSANAVTLRKLDAFNNGVSYSVDITCSSHTSGRLSIYLNDNEVGDITSTGTYRYLVTGDVDGRLQFLIRSGDTILDISNVSVKEITNAVEYKNIPQTARELYSLEDDIWTGSNELITNGDFTTDSDWDKTGGWVIESGFASCDGTQVVSSEIWQNDLLVSDRTYELSFDVITLLAGSVKGKVGGLSTESIFSVGSYKYLITNTNNLPRSGLVATGDFTGSIDNVSVKEVIEVVEQAAFSPVTAPMTLTEAWTTRGTSYNTLNTSASASVRVDATISNTDNGVLMEAGATGAGIVLYVYSGVLYFQCGNGSAYGTASNRAEVSYTLPVGEADYIIEWSADTSNSVLYVNGVAVGSQTFSNVNLAGGDQGTLGEVQNAVPVNRGGWVSDGAGAYTNTITKCDVFNNQITSDV